MRHRDATLVYGATAVYSTRPTSVAPRASAGHPPTSSSDIRTHTPDPIRERASAPTSPLRLVTAQVEAPGVEPDTFLRLASGEPRGLWARGERWVAHRGVLREIRCDADDVDATGDRFERVGRLTRALPAPVEESGNVRLYGGFAFGDDHRAEDAWTGFPAALFHLPEVELTGDASGTGHLRVRGVAHPDEVVAVQERLQGRALALLNALRGSIPAAPNGGAPGGRARLEALRRDAWEGAVEGLLRAIARGRVSKVVLARTLDVETAAPVDPVDLVAALRTGNPGTHVFLFEPEPGKVLLGAAPEALATLRRGVFHATAVAGSVARGDDQAEQRRLAQVLHASQKDRAEQRVVVEDMVSRLSALASDVKAEAEPHVLTLARIQHLETEIRARVDERTSVLDLVAALHPTPAVCGVPREEALVLLRRDEPFERGWYAGPVGWFTLGGDGHFVPALRTTVGGGACWRLFAGAGIVEGSRPAAEWEETGIKFQPVLQALAAIGVQLPGEADAGGSPEES